MKLLVKYRFDMIKGTEVQQVEAEVDLDLKIPKGKELNLPDLLNNDKLNEALIKQSESKHSGKVVTLEVTEIIKR